MTDSKNLSLPEDLILEILLLLPLKSLIRFRCVSALWFTLISEPNFTKSHFDLVSSPSNRVIYIGRKIPRYEVRSIDIDAPFLNDSTPRKLNLPPGTSTAWVHMRGSCRGFILLDNVYLPKLVIWNPSTGLYKILPKSPIVSSGRNMLRPLYGFGYDASTDDYLVVGHYEVDLVPRLEFYSVRTNSWKEIGCTYFPCVYPWFQSGLFFNGAIHWLAFRKYKSIKVIIAFDLTKKILSEVSSLPNVGYFNNRFGDFGNLMIIRGCLSVCYWSRWGHKTKIWVMKEYKVQSSWIKYEILWSWIPICSAKGGEFVVYAQDRGQLAKFNDKGQRLEHCTYCDDPIGFRAAMYTETLLSLPSDSGEARERE